MGSAEAPSIIGGRYSQLTGLEKRDHLFDQGVRATAYADGELPDVHGGVLQFAELTADTFHKHSLHETLTRVSDELEQPHAKLFHTYGSTAKILFVAEEDTPYTGIFGERAAHGLVRFSYAGPVIGIGVVPGLGLKFPVDGDRPSANLVAMRMLDSQQSRLPLAEPHHSVFQHAFTNILPDPAHINLVMRGVKAAFERVAETGRGLHQPVNTLAAIRTTGLAVVPQDVVAPPRLIFRPTNAVTDVSNPTIDFREDLARNVPSGMTIYDVFALSESEERRLNADGQSAAEDLLPHAAKIGTIKTESDFVASRYGDFRLFFKHDATFLREEFRHNE